MKLLAFVVLVSQLAFASSSDSSNHNLNHTILGHWEAENVIMGRGVQFRLAFEFSENHMNIKVNCHFHDGAYLSSTTSSIINYRGSDIIIREYSENVANDGYRYCSATLKPSVWTTHFDSYGRLVLYAPTPYQTRFLLVRTRDEI